MATITWDSKLATVAAKRASKIEKAFGFRTVGDLLSHYPRRYVEKGELSGPSGFVLDEHITIIARVISSQQVPYKDKRRGGMAFRLEVVVETSADQLTLTFFDKKKHIANWRAGNIRVGTHGLFSGKVSRFRNRWQLTNPETKVYSNEKMESGLDQAYAEWDSLPDLLTIYPATSAVQSWQIQDAIELALDLVDAVPDPLPAAVRLSHGLIGARQALEWIHRPGSWQNKGAAEKRLRFEEAFVTQTVLAQRRVALRALDTQPRTGIADGLLDRFDARLPFDLTAGQQLVAEQILDDLAMDHPMHRLLHGEVGSGKTVVALRAMLRVIDSGGQAALLAPTEVLAQQHHRSITSMLGDLAAGGMLGGAEDGTQVALLTGSQGASARTSASQLVSSGAAGIVVGTHALLGETVHFADLGLVVVDEQHRFGVEQRAALTAKADEAPPHVLVMTATPIPRTVAMTVFGDLETSTLVELPTGRAQIQSSVVPMLDRPVWLERAWSRIREEAEKGHQTYIVCPRIAGAETSRRLDDEEPTGSDEPGPATDAGNAKSKERELAAVEEIAPALGGGVLQGLRVEALHGRLASDRKEEVMRAFAAGDIDVLVSTTVIEVGVDVPNATVMVILDADRFGVSQLHQLRGRVGRSSLPGLCLLVTRSEAGSSARERLEAVAATFDGFELSRIDLEQRREGDVLGATQSGRRSGLRLLSVLKHEDVIVAARLSATDVVEKDPGLSSEPALADAVCALVESEQADYLEKA